MDNATLRKVQLAQLEIANEIKRICDENEIHYFLDSGSLLGAVRHKGFIPWDDDMDFGMLRVDYERFLKIAPVKLKKEYYLQTWHTDPYYPFAFAKVRKRGTVYQEAAMAHCRAQNELYVDVFPYDHFPDNVRLQRRQGRCIMLYRYAILMKRGVKPWINHTGRFERFLVICKYIPFIVFSVFHNTDKMISKIEPIMSKYNKMQTAKYYPQGSSAYGKWTISASCLNKYVDLPFENTSFRAPYQYKRYLKETYGDYMKLPPKEKRENHHHITRVKL